MGSVFLVVMLCLLIPANTSAQNVGDLSPNPNNNNSIGNPFSPGGSWSFNGQSNPNAPRAAPTSPYAWSNVSPQLPRRPIDNQPDLLTFRTPRTAGPMVPETSRGPYGITLPSNHPLAVGGR